jgi:D-Tyr-tRNAtyr deacylase
MKALLFHFKKYKVKFVEYSNKSIVNKIENEEIFQTINNGILVFVTIEENDDVKKIYKSLEKDIIDFLNQT